jgi:hypothetical protein
LVSLNVNHEKHLLRAIDDTCASISIILKTDTSGNLIRNDESNETIRNTMIGQFTTNETGLVIFSLLEFHLKKQISQVFHFDDRSKTLNINDMIFVQNLLIELAIILGFNDKTVTWDTDTYNIPKKDRGTLNTAMVKEATNMYDNFRKEKQHQLLNLLPKYEHLFDGTLGQFNMDPTSCHLVDKGVNPVHAPSYNASMVVEQQLRTKITRLVDI